MLEAKFADAITELHNIARLVENEYGKGNLSDDIRNVANRLNFLATEGKKGN